MSKSNRDRNVKWDRRQARRAKDNRSEYAAYAEYQKNNDMRVKK